MIQVHLRSESDSKSCWILSCRQPWRPKWPKWQENTCENPQSASHLWSVSWKGTSTNSLSKSKPSKMSMSVDICFLAHSIGDGEAGEWRVWRCCLGVNTGIWSLVLVKPSEPTWGGFNCEETGKSNESFHKCNKQMIDDLSCWIQFLANASQPLPVSKQWTHRHNDSYSPFLHAMLYTQNTLSWHAHFLLTLSDLQKTDWLFAVFMTGQRRIAASSVFAWFRHLSSRVLLLNVVQG